MFYKKQILYNNFVLMRDPADTKLKVVEKERERSKMKISLQRGVKKT